MMGAAMIGIAGAIARLEARFEDWRHNASHVARVQTTDRRDLATGRPVMEVVDPDRADRFMATFVEAREQLRALTYVEVKDLEAAIGAIEASVAWLDRQAA